MLAYAIASWFLFPALVRMDGPLKFAPKHELVLLNPFQPGAVAPAGTWTVIGGSGFPSVMTVAFSPKYDARTSLFPVNRVYIRQPLTSG